ncbi:protein NO VEIN domain-containing protein [Nocardia noduli]|uniref:protein NO VEIN domain-containing protein n=1 Tax=Nocardia noduli TaxID=2815722 RepID=UPI001C24A99E|nr:DUF3883 domain-containing protein [Nocardia noduli]
MRGGQLALQIREMETGWRQRGVRSVHKPLLVALLLARFGATGSAAVSYDDIAPQLAVLLDRFVSAGSRSQPHYPFWRLRNDGFWMIDRAAELRVNNSGDVRPGDLTSEFSGRWTDEALVELRAFGGQTYLDIVLDAYFPPAERPEILHAVLELAGARDMAAESARTLMVWIGSVSRDNFEFARESATWGMKHRLETGVESCRYVLFGTYFDADGNGNPRVGSEAWLAKGSANLVLGEINGPQYEGTAPHWPDEFEKSEVIYPYRFGFGELDDRRQIALHRVLVPSAIESLRRAACSGKVTTADLRDSPLLSVARRRRTGVFQNADVSFPSSKIYVGSKLTNGAPRSADPRLKKAVEDRSVRLAVEFMEKRKWSVELLGKPFDLVCKRANGEEKHVEVKGTTGAGTTVNYTPNEVVHFRSCPYGADLIVVRDIQVDLTTYEASGGELLHCENYTAPDEHLQPSAWVGQVPAWGGR